MLLAGDGRSEHT